MSERWRQVVLGLAVAVFLTSGVRAQQSAISSWPATASPQGQDTEERDRSGAAQTNTTVVPRTRAAEPKAQAGHGTSQVTLVALLTQDGQRIDQGLVWRIFQEGKEGGEGAKSKLVSLHREASPVLRLQPGDYIINAAFGRAHLTRRISVRPGAHSNETFVLNAGGLRLTALVGKGEAAPPSSVTYEIYSDERDQFGNRSRIIGGVRPGLIIRLNAGIYHIVSTYGDANAQVRADVTVEAGKLTDATVAHPAAKVTFKLVTRAGGEALADTQWSVIDAQGEVVKESVGALPTHTLAPGQYTVSAKSAGRVFRRAFSVQHGDNTQVEVVIQ